MKKKERYMTHQSQYSLYVGRDGSEHEFISLLRHVRTYIHFLYCTAYESQSTCRYLNNNL